MSDLATALQQVLRQVREETPHTESCANARHYGRDCYCGQPERVETEQARRVVKILYAACSAAVDCTRPGHDGDHGLHVLEAVEGAAQQERGSA